MKIKTAELKDAALDWAVLLAKNATEGVDLAKTYVGADGRKYLLTSGGFTVNYLDWSQGGPVILEGGIAHGRTRNGKGYAAWVGYASDFGMVKFSVGPTPLIAVMRCWVASELGDEVDVPEELVSEPGSQPVDDVSLSSDESPMFQK